jgi:hypothetical protein
MSQRARRDCNAKRLFASLFDISFSSLITTKIIKVLYVLILIGIALFTVVVVISALATDPGTGVLALIVAPLIGLLYAIMARVWLEVIIVLFKISDNTSQLVHQGAGGQPGGGQPAYAGLGGGGPAPAIQPGGPGGGFGPPSGHAVPGPPQTRQEPLEGGMKAGWHPDPQGEKRLRFWDGSRWTEHTSD